MSRRSTVERYVEGIGINILSNVIWFLMGTVGFYTLLVFLIRNLAWTLSAALATICLGLGFIVWTQRRMLGRLQRLFGGDTYVPVDLGGDNLNWVWDHPDLPKGKIWLRSVLFDIKKDEQNHLAGMMVAPSENNELRSHDVQVEVKNVETIYVLLNTAFGLRVNPVDKVEWEGQRIGAIRLTFRDRSVQEVPLVLGQNIRDWSPGNQPYAVFRLADPSAVPVWTSGDKRGSFDMLQIEVPNSPADLVRISVSAQLEVPQPVRPATLAALQAQVLQPEGNGEVVPQVAARVVEQSFPQIHILAITCQIAEA